MSDSIDSLVLKALSGVSDSLIPLALGQSNDISLRAKMSYAALVSGITLSRFGLGAVHGIAGPWADYARCLTAWPAESFCFRL